MVPEMTGAARDLVRHAAKKLAAIGEFDAASLRLPRLATRNDACDNGRTFENGASRDIGRWYAGGGLVAAAHAQVPQSIPYFPNVKMVARPQLSISIVSRPAM